MLNKISGMIREYAMLQPGDALVCAVSGGADSMALLWGMYLLREKLDIRLSAAHFNHHLRGAESDRDEMFVREFCCRYDIPLAVGGACVTAGEKGLEAAAREARYCFFATLPGKIATAHTANDNAETVLLRLIRGTGLKGLGAISPVRGPLIRPMLTVTRQEVLAFLEEYHIPFVEDSSNAQQQFLRNRIRQGVMPLLEAENPRLAENLSAMAMQLRQEESLLAQLTEEKRTLQICSLRRMHPALRSRIIEEFLVCSGLREPERRHVAMAEALVFSEKPSARAELGHGITIERCYDHLRVLDQAEPLRTVRLSCPGVTPVPQLGLQVVCCLTRQPENTPDCFTVEAEGDVYLRCRRAGDSIRLPGGTKSLKKLFIDRKIPASERQQIPVLADDAGVLGVYGFGADLDRIPRQLPAWQFRFEKTD